MLSEGQLDVKQILKFAWILLQFVLVEKFKNFYYLKT